MDKRFAAAGAAGAAGMLCLLLLVLGVMPGVSTGETPSPAPTPRGQCISTPYFYANDAQVGSNRFGPGINDPSVEAGMARFDLKLRSDAAFAAVWEDVILYDMANATPEWYDTRATDFLGNEDLWCEQVEKIYAAIDKMTVDDRSEAYETLLMVPRGDAVPAIRKTERPVPMEHVLVIHLKDGRTEFARYVCDLQPARPKIPGIPVVSVPVPPAPSLPPGVTIPPTTPTVPTTRPPTVPTTTRPPVTPTTRPPVTPTTRPVPLCPDGSPLPPSGLCPKNPNQSTAAGGQHGGQEEGPSEGPTPAPAATPPATYVPPPPPTAPPTTRPNPPTPPPTTSPPATTPPSTAPPTTWVGPPR